MKSKSNANSMSYETKTIIVILLLLFVLPAGLVLMWIWMKWPLWLKILLTVIPFLFTFLIIGFVLSILAIVFSNKDVQKQMQENVQVEVSQQQNQTAYDMSDWKTFSDPVSHYSFQYPPDFRTLPGLGNNVFYSQDSSFDPTTKAKTHGIEIGSAVLVAGQDTKKYIGPNTTTDSDLTSQLVLPEGSSAKAYINTEDITVAIDYIDNKKNMRILIWCGGENENTSGCKNVLSAVLSSFTFTQ